MQLVHNDHSLFLWTFIFLTNCLFHLINLNKVVRTPRSPPAYRLTNHVYQTLASTEAHTNKWGDRIICPWPARRKQFGWHSQLYYSILQCLCWNVWEYLYGDKGFQSWRLWHCFLNPSLPFCTTQLCSFKCLFFFHNAISW